MHMRHHLHKWQTTMVQYSCLVLHHYTSKQHQNKNSRYVHRAVKTYTDPTIWPLLERLKSYYELFLRIITDYFDLLRYIYSRIRRFVTRCHEQTHTAFYELFIRIATSILQKVMIHRSFYVFTCYYDYSYEYLRVLAISLAKACIKIRQICIIRAYSTTDRETLAYERNRLHF